MVYEQCSPYEERGEGEGERGEEGEGGGRGKEWGRGGGERGAGR
jgi:hypothetical protein